MERMLDKPVGRKSICAFFNPAQLPVPKLTEECHSYKLLLKSSVKLLYLIQKGFCGIEGKNISRGK